MISVRRKVAQLNIKYRKKLGPHNRYLHRGPTWQSYGPKAESQFISGEINITGIVYEI